MEQRILVIENEPFFLREMGETLTSFGYRVELAATADEGLARFRRSRFDAILLDLLLGETTAWELIHQIREVDTRVGVILFSAVADHLHEDVVYARGFDLLLDKPTDATTLQQAVGKVCRLAAERVAAGRDEG